MSNLDQIIEARNRATFDTIYQTTKAGADGVAGAAGPAGADGAPGIDGTDGLSAFEIAVANGFIGTELDWLASLVGATGATGPAGADGADGLSAYQVAVANGFVGTEADWLLSLIGTDGADGADGVGVPVGGTEGQILAKIDATNYNTEWIDNYTNQIKHLVKADEGITKGQVVYVNGANGTNILVKKASNDTEATSSKVLGLAESTMALNDQAYVVSEGLLSGLNTNSATIGDPVWLGTNGNLIFGLINKPYAPAHLVYIGVVTRVSATVGEIFVHPQNGFELEELHNVDLKTVAPVNNDILVYNSTSGLWKPTQQQSIYPTIQTVTITTASLASGAIEKSTINISQGYRLLSLSTNKGCRIRLYTTISGRNSDELRAVGIDAAESIGLMFEYNDIAAVLVDISPAVDGYLSSGIAVPYSITNNDASTGTVSVTFNYLRTI